MKIIYPCKQIKRIAYGGSIDRSFNSQQLDISKDINRLVNRRQELGVSGRDKALNSGLVDFLLLLSGEEKRKEV